MDDATAKTGPERQAYEIRVGGRLTAHWATRFDGLTLTSLDDGTTVMRGTLADQAALHGVLRRLADLGIPLLSLRLQDHDTDPTQTAPGD